MKWATLPRFPRPSLSEDPSGGWRKFASFLSMGLLVSVACNVLQQVYITETRSEIRVQVVPIAVQDRKDQVYYIPPANNSPISSEAILASNWAVQYVTQRHSLFRSGVEREKSWGPGGFVQAFSSDQVWREFQTVRDGLLGNKDDRLWQEVKNVEIKEAVPGYRRVFFTLATFRNQAGRDLDVGSINLEATLRYEWRTQTVDDPAKAGTMLNPGGMFITDYRMGKI